MKTAAFLAAMFLACATTAFANPVAKGTLDDARAMIPALGLVEVQGAPVPAAGPVVAVAPPPMPQMSCQEMFDVFETQAQRRGDQIRPKKICEWMSRLRCAQDPGKPDPCAIKL